MRLLPCCCAGLPTLALLLLFVFKARGDCIMPDKIKFAELKSGELKGSYSVGTRLTFRCIPGYELISGTIPRITCTSASEWEPKDPQFCQGRRCPNPDIENGGFVSSKDLRLGDEITFQCNEGYRLIGRRTAHCTLNAGEVAWDYQPYCQRIPCFPPPPIAHGTETGNGRDEYTYGAAVTYKCDAGYSLIGRKTIFCRVAADGENGEWDFLPPECKVVECPRPEIEHGSLSAFQPSYTYEHSLVVSCDPGYTFSGESLIKCGADNNWHPRIPTCVLSTTTTTTTPPLPPPPKTTASTTVPSGTAPGSTTVSTEETTEMESSKPPKGEPGSGIGAIEETTDIGLNKALAIALGCFVLFNLVAVIVFALYARGHRAQGEMDASTSPADSYHIVPRNKLKGQKEPTSMI